MRTKLRTGTIANLNGRPICECLIFDRSPKGARIKLSGNVQLPDKVVFNDTAAAASGIAQVRWRRQYDVGLYLADGFREARSNEAPPPGPPPFRVPEAPSTMPKIDDRPGANWPFRGVIA